MVCQANKCVSPLEPSGPFRDLFKAFGNFFGSDSGSQSAGSRAGGSYLKIGRAAAGPGSTPVRSALLLLGAVNAQGAAAALAFTDHHVDRTYRRKVTVVKP